MQIDDKTATKRETASRPFSWGGVASWVTSNFVCKERVDRRFWKRYDVRDGRA
jgi:hypothetical protein